MRITNLNPDTDIGASAWFLEMEGHNLLMDAGTHPRREGRAGLPLYDLVKKHELDAVAISHCHHDHVGSLPIALRYFPQAHVLMTELSYFLIERVLHNSVNVMTRQRDELGIKEYPLYRHDELDELAARFQGFKYNREVDWGAFAKARAGFLSPTLEFYDAGHALGSAGIAVSGQKEKLFYTGDVCFHDQTILKSARFEDVRADVLIMETTRGNRPIPPGFSRESEIERLSHAIQQVLARKGSVLIPTFALGRTQEILALLAIMTAQGKLKRQPIYVGGLGRVFTEIYDIESHRSHRQHPNLQLHEALNIVVLEQGQAQSMNLSGRIFVITAGMMTEKTAAHDLALRMTGDPRQSIFLVGYTDPGTPGGHLRAAKQGETFLFSASGGNLTRNCEVQEFDLTAHANRGELLDFVGTVEPRAVLLGHGEEPSRRWFEEQIHERWPKIKVFQPQPGKVVEV
ncbi:MAG TPA: MBL fold metallo-hydrolase [Verrucomicrobiae bacterium]|nr:MBL fold metallo-hydrolase [Verrucomicrobiae bacterium]